MVGEASDSRARPSMTAGLIRHQRSDAWDGLIPASGVLRKPTGGEKDGERDTRDDQEVWAEVVGREAQGRD